MHRRGVRWAMSSRSFLPAALLLLTLSTVACSGAAASAVPSTPPTLSTTPPTTPSPTVAGIAHPTGANEIVLRMDVAGGFVPPEFLAARLPTFTLYGDGTVVFLSTAQAKQRADNVSVGQPVRTAKLSEEQLQALIEYALTDGGLAIAKTEYQNMMVADAPTTVFDINAAGDSKTVSAYGLGFDGQPGPDTAVLKQLQALSERLADFDQGGTIASNPYQAAAYRGVILEQQGAVQGVQVADWPWIDIKPSDFKMPADANALQQGTKTLAPAEASAVGVAGFENGVSGGIFLKGPDGKIYSLVIRPLLPDETA
jgi:hypothetical protein